MKSRIAKSVVWVVWSKGGIQVLSFLTTLLVARQLIPSDYGLMALSNVWTTIFVLVTEMGLGAAIIRFRGLDVPELNSLFWLIMSLAVVGYFGLFLCAPFIATWFGSPKLVDVIRVAGLILPISSLKVVPESLLRKRLALDRVSQGQVLATAVVSPVVIVLAYWGAGVWTLVTGALLIPATQVIFCFWVVQWWPGIRMGGTHLKPAIEFSLKTLGTRVSWALYQQSDIIILGKLFGESELGFFSMGKELATLPVRKLTSLVNELAFPVMAELQDDLSSLRNAFFRGIRLAGCIIFPICIGLFLVGEDLVLVALSDKWLGSVHIMKILCLYALVSGISSLFGPVLLARNRAGIMFQYTLLQLVVMPIAFFIAAKQFGAFGVALAWATVYPALLVILIWLVLQEIQSNWHDFTYTFWPPALGAGLMIMAILLMEAIFSGMPSFHYPIIKLVTLIFCGGLVYCLGIISFGGVVKKEILEIVGWIFRGWPQRIFQLRPKSF